MYDRQIDVANRLVFINRKDYVEMDLSVLPEDVTFYCEYEGDWWIERKPFDGQEKNDDIHHVALNLLAEAERLWYKEKELAQNGKL
jgi:hypothetical protein